MYGQSFTGGFLPDGDGGTDKTGPEKGIRGSQSLDKSKKKSTIVPLTIKTVLEISAQSGENLEIDGCPITQVIVLGRVLATEEHPTRCIFTLDDTTGVMEILFYKKSDETPLMLTKLSLKKNMYLKAVIAIKPFKDKKLYVTTNLEEVQDYNQITYFLLSCFLAHSQRVQGFVEPPEEKQQINYQYSKSRSFENPSPVNKAVQNSVVQPSNDGSKGINRRLVI